MPSTRTVQTLSLAVTTPTAVAADATGDKFAIGSSPVFVRIINGSGASITATLDDPNTLTPEGAQTFNPDVQFVVPAAGSRIVKISDGRRFTSPTDGLATLTWSAAASVTVEYTQ